jgi:ATP phosphoribosyltransferase
MLSTGKRVKIAVPNKGRLREPVIELLKAAGYRFRIKERMLYASCANEEVTLIFVRADDIPKLVESGAVEFGITGQDLVKEKKARVRELLPLDLGRCRLCVAVHEGARRSLESLSGGRIATSFPHITQAWFAARKIPVACLEMSGSLEIMVGLGLADAIVDIVESGDTLKENNLVVLEEIGRYQTVLIAHRDEARSSRAASLRRRIEGICIARTYSMLEYNITRRLLKKAETITPGFESPTVSDLDEQGWCAVKVMVEKHRVIEAMDRLERLGATAILETEIKNCRL